MRYAILKRMTDGQKTVGYILLSEDKKEIRARALDTYKLAYAGSIVNATYNKHTKGLSGRNCDLRSLPTIDISTIKNEVTQKTESKQAEIKKTTAQTSGSTMFPRKEDIKAGWKPATNTQSHIQQTVSNPKTTEKSVEIVKSTPVEPVKPEKLNTKSSDNNSNTRVNIAGAPEILFGDTDNVIERRSKEDIEDFKKVADRKRYKADLFGIDIREQISNAIDKSEEGASNPNIELNTSKLINVELTEQMADFLGIDRLPVENPQKPHIIFKAALNYMQDTSDLYALPLTSKMLSIADKLSIESERVYFDGYNSIYQVWFNSLDRKKSGMEYIASIIIALCGNKIVYIIPTDGNFMGVGGARLEYCRVLGPIFEMLQVGDEIGYEIRVSNHIMNSYEWPETKDRLLSVIKNNTIIMSFNTRNTVYMYVPALDLVYTLNTVGKNHKSGRVGYNWAILSTRHKITNIVTYDKFIKSRQSSARAEEAFNELISIADSNSAEIELNYHKRVCFYPELLRIIAKGGPAKSKHYNYRGFYRITREELAGLNYSPYVYEKPLSWFTNLQKNNKIQEENIEVFEDYKIKMYRSTGGIIKSGTSMIKGGSNLIIYAVTNNYDTLVSVYVTDLYKLAKVIDNLDLDNLVEDRNAVIDNSVIPTKIDGRRFMVLDTFGDYYRFHKKSGYGHLVFGAEIAIDLATGLPYLVLRTSTTMRVASNLERVPYWDFPILPLTNLEYAYKRLFEGKKVAGGKRAVGIMNQDLALALLDGEPESSLPEDLVKLRKILINQIPISKKQASTMVAYNIQGDAFYAYPKRDGNYAYEDPTQSSEYEDIDDGNYVDYGDSSYSITDNTEAEENYEDYENYDDYSGGESGDFDDSGESGVMSFETFYELAKSSGVTDIDAARALYIQMMPNS